MEDCVAETASYETLSKKHMLTHEEFVDKPSKSKNAAKHWRHCLEGRQQRAHGAVAAAPRLCVHVDHCQTSDARAFRVTFDLDSTFGIMYSLSALRVGLRYQPIPPRTIQVKGNFHVKEDDGVEATFQRDTDQFFDFENIVHLPLGSMLGEEDFKLFVYFPKIQRDRHKTTLLTSIQHRTWHDGIFYEAVRRIMPTDFISSFPNYDTAKINSTTAQMENRVRHGRSLGTNSALHFDFQPQHLGRLWTEIESIIESNDELNDVFGGARIFFDAKNTKTRTQSESMLDAMEQFKRRIDATFNYDHIRAMFIDVGREVVPTNQEPQTLFWRECCCVHAVTKLFAPGNTKLPRGCYTLYNHCGIRDFVNCTATPPRDSPIRKWGLLYLQRYGKIKDTAEVTKHFPFAAEGIDDLALGSRRAKDLASAGKTYVEYPVVQGNYAHSKERIHNNVRCHQSKVFSAREEGRITLQSFEDLLGVVRRQHGLDVDANDHVLCSPYALAPFWSIPTHLYLFFFWHSINRICSTFEGILASVRNDPTPDQSNLLLMLLAILRTFVQATNFPAHRKLWTNVTISGRDRGQAVTRIGAGFSLTMRDFGFCWLKPIVDWKAKTFRIPWQKHIMFDNTPILRKFRVHRNAVVRHEHNNDRIATCARLIYRLRTAAVHTQILHVMIDFVLHQFRRDVLDYVRKDFSRDTTTSLERAPFTEDFLKPLYSSRHLHIVERTNAKFHNAPKLLMHHLFDDLDDITDDSQSTKRRDGRQNWSHREFRKLAGAVLDVVRGPDFLLPAGSSTPGRYFMDTLSIRCMRQHWILPNPEPSSNTLVKLESGANKRLWLSVEQRSLNCPGIRDKALNCSWTIGVGKLKRQTPLKPLPWLEWQSHDIESHFNRLASEQNIPQRDRPPSPVSITADEESDAEMDDLSI